MDNRSRSASNSNSFRSPLLITAGLIPLPGLVTGWPKNSWRVDWRESTADAIARFLVGFVIGATACVLLVSVFFWPGRRRSRRGDIRSRYEIMGESEWIVGLFLATLLAPGLIAALGTRATQKSPPENPVT